MFEDISIYKKRSLSSSGKGGGFFFFLGVGTKIEP